MRAIFEPKAFTSSSCVVAVSSTVSWSSAAQSTSTSVTPPSLISTSASAIGWLMYGEDSASLRRWSRCLCAAKASAFSSKARSPRSAPLFMEKPLEDQQPRADRDGGIGDVERRPMPAEGMEIEEVDHLAEAQPVDEVAERPAQDQRQPAAKHRLRRRAQKQHADDDGGDERENDEQRRLPAGRVGEKAERRALVEYQDQGEEAAQRSPLAGREAAEHGPFGDLVFDDDRRCRREPAPVSRHTAVFRRVRGGCCGSGST